MDPIVIDPVTRISGDARIKISFTEEGGVEDTVFIASGFRGFERLAQGAHLDNVIPLVSRICSNCSAFHQVAAAQAIESAAEVQISETSRKLRELILLGQLLHSHALSLALHSLPDLLFPMSDVAVRNILSIYRVEEEIVRKVFSLRALGEKVVDTVGGSSIHPVNILPGGVLRPLREERRAELLEMLTQSESLINEMSRLVKMLLKRNQEMIQGQQDAETAHAALWVEKGLALQGGRVRVINERNQLMEEVSSEQFFDRITEGVLPHTHIKTARFQENIIFRVGPLSRLSVAGRLGTPKAEGELAEVSYLWEGVPQKSLIYHAARMVEMVYAWERMVELLKETGITGGDLLRQVEPKSGTGVGLVESPGGILGYYLEINDRGCLERLNIISPLQCNLLPLEEGLRRSARQLAEVLEAQEGMRNRLEMVARSYAPCIPCGVH